MWQMEGTESILITGRSARVYYLMKKSTEIVIYYTSFGNGKNEKYDDNC